MHFLLQNIHPITIVRLQEKKFAKETTFTRVLLPESRTQYARESSNPRSAGHSHRPEAEAEALSGVASGTAGHMS